MLKRRIWILLPLVAAIGLFASAVPGAGFVADDAFNLAEHARHGDWLGEWSNPTYAHAGGERGHIWRPIPATVQHMAAMLFGRTGSVFRGLNLSVHLLNVLLLGLVARRLGASKSAAGLLAALWTTHPVIPEAVCWSSDIYDLMATTALLSGVWLLTQPLTFNRLLSLSGITLIGALCKESSLAFIGVVPLVALTLHGRRSTIHALIAAGAGGAIFWAWHGAITAQGYMGAASATPLLASVDAGLSAVGWWVAPPSRAPMAHLFDRALDQREVWMGMGVLATLTFLATHQAKSKKEGRFFILSIGAGLLLLVPAAIGIPFIGVAPLRYDYTPLALVLALAGGGCTAAVSRSWMAGILAVCALNGNRVANRVPAFDSDLSLWSAERKAEPNNPYAAGSLARAWVAEGRTQEAVRLWAWAADTTPPGVRVFDKANERWLLAQTAFLKGAPAIALEQTNKLLAEAPESAPAMAHCLRADSLDALGRHEEASAAAVFCGL